MHSSFVSFFFSAVRKQELLQISENCSRVPANGATSFYEACQSFWFVQQLIQIESSGHSISPGRFDQYMYPYYKEDIDKGVITREFAQELIDCIWVKMNDLNKCRDEESAKGFAGYSLFQNLIVGGQNKYGEDVTNDLSFMCIEASKQVFLPQPSLSIRVWNGSPHELLMKAADLTRTAVYIPFVEDHLQMFHAQKFEVLLLQRTHLTYMVHAQRSFQNDFPVQVQENSEYLFHQWLLLYLHGDFL